MKHLDKTIPNITRVEAEGDEKTHTVRIKNALGSYTPGEIYLIDSRLYTPCETRVDDPGYVYFDLGRAAKEKVAITQGLVGRAARRKYQHVMRQKARKAKQALTE